MLGILGSRTHPSGAEQNKSNELNSSKKKCFPHNCPQISRKPLFTCKNSQVAVRICSWERVTGNPGWALALSPSKTNGKTNSCPREQTGRKRAESRSCSASATWQTRCQGRCLLIQLPASARITFLLVFPAVFLPEVLLVSFKHQVQVVVVVEKWGKLPLSLGKSRNS